jgi:cell division protein FtsB
MVSEMRRLQQRIRDLEAELTRLQAQNDALAAQSRDEAFTRLQDREPALT